MVSIWVWKHTLQINYNTDQSFYRTSYMSCLWKYNPQWISHLECGVYKNKGKKERKYYKRNICGKQTAIVSESLRAGICSVV